MELDEPATSKNLSGKIKVSDAISLVIPVEVAVSSLFL